MAPEFLPYNLVITKAYLTFRNNRNVLFWAIDEIDFFCVQLKVLMWRYSRVFRVRICFVFRRYNVKWIDSFVDRIGRTFCSSNIPVVNQLEHHLSGLRRSVLKSPLKSNLSCFYSSYSWSVSSSFAFSAMSGWCLSPISLLFSENISEKRERTVSSIKHERFSTGSKAHCKSSIAKNMWPSRTYFLKICGIKANEIFLLVRGRYVALPLWTTHLCWSFFHI